MRPDDAGIASGLVNTGQQVGGAIGVAAATTIAATATTHYLDLHPGAPAAGLTHGFGIAFYVLAGIAAAAAVLSVRHHRAAAGPRRRARAARARGAGARGGGMRSLEEGRRDVGVPAALPGKSSVRC